MTASSISSNYNGQSQCNDGGLSYKWDVCVRVWLCVCACVRACVSACVCVCVHAHACVKTLLAYCACYRKNRRKTIWINYVGDKMYMYCIFIYTVCGMLLHIKLRVDLRVHPQPCVALIILYLVL